ncbi:hypothetical protein ASPWEDRAFT_172113 [Aspergillus wentii DTO 134E9]|uniref:Cyclin N-terminal domain-containing protein n=1 Tax=Aspergillus wentii DTO 134E9 TaxID=1073089 RepID=A0A1L9RKC6_ASPWE|nr:uncharacterized protein ASPWEDRAFT_172113 [Aspergillus wentii DTO 134E9]KAI9923467.1 hypothetical protein MW887_008628 [Aspergillus wentii]OJJ35297.1 hypothetical protein ASPWEDRAFT_172113 [Aspergillus wentii DTO 134E9]
MPPPILASHPYSSALGPITPAFHLYSQEDGSTACSKKQLPPTIPHTSDHHWTAPFRDGLPTPPSDMTGVAYNAIPYSNYGGKLDGMSLHPYSKAPSNSRPTFDHSSAIIPSSKSQSHAPVKEAPASEPSQKKPSSSVGSRLQIPTSINNSKGNLAEFAAQMTCLFWFESTAKLKAIEERLNPTSHLVPEAMPAPGFQKWVSSILATTQVSQNVILLALMFVYRLKKFNPGVRGKKGSEFRLMTIALMLGNKFLDDNTYTNKTWAEVSGISVQEIHIMEVEFLSNIRYNLFASKENWAEWHVKLGLFADFFTRASQVPEEKDLSPTTPVLRISPSLGPAPRMQSSSLSKLPSPPASESLRPQPWNLPFNGSTYTAPPQLGNEIPPVASRKRSRDEQTEEHPAKRIALPNGIPTPASTLPPSSGLPSIPALPPVLTPTSAPSHASMPGSLSRLPRPNFPTSTNTLAPTIPTPVPHLPSAGRAMSSAYNPSTNWAQQLPPSAPVPPLSAGLYNNSMSLPDPVRHHSPYGVSSATVSPAASAYSVHTPQTHLSPSFFLANRNSPYRPVRTVNTLLIPPPSTSLQQQRSVPFDHMHYQPLGKTAAERKTGLLPYLHQDSWQQGPFVQPFYQSTQNYSG